MPIMHVHIYGLFSYTQIWFENIILLPHWLCHLGGRLIAVVLSSFHQSIIHPFISLMCTEAVLCISYFASGQE